MKHTCFLSSHWGNVYHSKRLWTHLDRLITCYCPLSQGIKDTSLFWESLCRLPLYAFPLKYKLSSTLHTLLTGVFRVVMTGSPYVQSIKVLLLGCQVSPLPILPTPPQKQVWISPNNVCILGNQAPEDLPHSAIFLLFYEAISYPPDWSWSV